MSAFASLSIATALALHPYAAPRTAGLLHVAPATAEPSPPVGDPTWDEVEAEAEAAAETAADAPPPPVVPSPAPEVTTVPQPPVKPDYNKGTGLIIAAGVTGALALAVGFTRMGLVKQCQNALQDADGVTSEQGIAAANTCFRGAGAANLAMVPLQWALNWATWGLAAGGGVVRGRWEGVEHVWAKRQAKKSGAFIGAGAALLAVGVIGRITAAALVARPFEKLAEGDADGFATALRLRYLGVQLSSSAIGVGAGLLAFGIAYRKTYRSESGRVQQVRVSPVLGTGGVGGAYSGFSFTGQF